MGPGDYLTIFTLGAAAWGAYRWWQQHMSSAAGGSAGSQGSGTGSEPGEPGAVPPHGNQAEPGEPGGSGTGADVTEYDAREAAAVLSGRRDLFIDVLAEMRTNDGAYRYSANQIATFVGGRAEDIKARVAARRPQPRVPGRIERPAGGW